MPGKGKLCSTALDFDMEEMNQYFADVCRDEDYQRPRKTQTRGTQPLEISPHLVFRVLCKTGDTTRRKNGKSAWVFCENAQSLTFPLKHITDHFLAQGKISACLKISKVIPLPKVATPGSLNELRPIAVCPIVSRIVERIMIKSFVATNYEEKIEARKHGFRIGGSTEKALVRLQNDCRHFQSVGFDYVRFISLDFSKAFDKVKHNLLVEKLYGCQFQYHVINLFADLITDRQQYVTRSGVKNAFVGPRNDSGNSEWITIFQLPHQRSLHRYGNHEAFLFR